MTRLQRYDRGLKLCYYRLFILNRTYVALEISFDKGLKVELTSFKYFHIKVKINTKYKAPYFTGSMLRGAMGYSLKKITCKSSTEEETCSCLYCQFYEVSNILHKYRFEIELGSGKFDFGLYLFDDACDGLADVLLALEIMLVEIGLSKEGYTFSKLEFFVNKKVIYKNGIFTSIPVVEKNLHIENFTSCLKLKLLTPLRIKKNNKLLRDDIDIKDILRSIYQREQELFYNKKVFKLDYKPKVKVSLKLLKYQELFRYSHRQRQKMNMGGIIGEMIIMGVDEESYRLLKLGEILGVGKQIVMGLGRIEIEHL